MATHFLDLPATDRLWWGGTEIRALWWGNELVWGEAVGRSREDFAVTARDGSGLSEPFATRASRSGEVPASAGRLRTLALPTAADLLGDDLLLWATPASGGLARNADGSGGEPGDGEPVGFVPDRAGGISPLVQPLDAARPLLIREPDGRAAVATDGIGRWMRADGAFAGPALYICAAVRFVRVGAYSRLFSGRRAGGGTDWSDAGLFSLESGSVGRFSLVRGRASRASVPHGTQSFVIEVYMSATQSMLAINGVGAINTHADVGAPQVAQLRIGTGSGLSTTEMGAATLHDLVVARALPSDATRTTLRTLAAERAGL